jgi:hypothetical protein
VVKPLMWAGSLLTAFGILALAFLGGIHYTSHEKFPRDGEVQITVKEEKIISIPPVVSGLALAGGLALMIIAARK